MTTAPESTARYIESAPEERREALLRLAATIRQNLPEGFEETLGYGMPAWVVPHSLYPAGYHCDPKVPLPFLSFASQKNFVALYHMGLYSDPALLGWFQQEYPKHSKTKLDMGKSCVRFKKPDAIPFALVGELCTRVTPQQWVATYEANVRR